MQTYSLKLISALVATVFVLVCSAGFAGIALAGEEAPLVAGGVEAVSVPGDAQASANLEAGATFAVDVEGVGLVFQVIDADAQTVRLGTGQGRGNGLADLAYPPDHKVVIPASVAYEGVEYAVKEVAASALQVQGESFDVDSQNYVGDVTIKADLDYIGEYAFGGTMSGGNNGQAAVYLPFAYRIAPGGAVRRIHIMAFHFCGIDELEFPEGSIVDMADVPTSSGENVANCYGLNHTSVVYPLSHYGEVRCAQSNLKALFIKSPYATVDPGDENQTRSVSLNVKRNNGGERIPYYAWAGTQAADVIANSSGLSGMVYLRSMAAFSDWTCPEWAVPEGTKEYTCPANVELGIRDGATYDAAPKPTAACIDDDGEWELQLGTDYTVEYYTADGSPLGSAPTRPGTYGVCYVGNDKSVWGSSALVSYTISADLSSATVDYDKEATSFAYTGMSVSPAVAVTQGGVKLASGLQYYARYVDSAGNVGTDEPTLPGSYVKRIASKSPWTGLRVEIPFQIREVAIAAVQVPNVALAGGSAKPVVTVLDADGKTIAPSAYTVQLMRDGAVLDGPITRAGAYQVQVEGDKRGCTGNAKCEFTVVAAEHALASAGQAGALTFTGQPLAPAFKVLDAGGAEVPASAYTVTYATEGGEPVADLLDAGTYTATLQAAGSEYAGQVSCEVVVGGRELGAGDLQVNVNHTSFDYIKSLDWAKIEGYAEGTQPRDKARVYLSAPVTPAEGDFGVKFGDAELLAGRDYEVTLDERVRSDEDDRDHAVSFTITLKGNYAGTVKSSELEGAPTVTVNKRIAHTNWYKGVLFSYAVDTDGLAVITGLGVDLSAATQASDVEAAYQPSVWGRKITIPASVTDGDVSYSVKSVCPNAFSIPRDGGNGTINRVWVLNGATSLEIEAGIQVIGAQAFSCSYMGDGGERQGIQELVLHEGLVCIEPYAFSGASEKCKEISIPASVERIGYAAFGQNMDNSVLERFEFAEGSKFFGGSVEGVAEVSDNISGGYVYLNGSRRYGGIIVDGGGLGSGTKETSELVSLTIPAQYTSSATLFTDFLNCSNVYWMADFIDDSAVGGATSIAVKMAGSRGGKVTVWGWDNAGTNLIEAVQGNSYLHYFKPFAVLGQGYEYVHATGGAKTYPGNVQVGEPTVSVVGGKQVVDWDFQLDFKNRKYKWAPVEGEDFTVSYVGPDGKPCSALDEAGIYTATLTGNGLTCYGTVTAQVKIGVELPADTQVVFDDQATDGYVYDGTAKRPGVASVTLPGAYAPLDGEYEYTVRYEDNVNAGAMRVVVEGHGGYYGSVTREFVIAPASIAGADVALNWARKTYNGSAQKPAVTSVGGMALGSADMVVAYSNASSADAGSYTVTVTGRGNYVGTAKVASYSIEPASIAGADVALSWTKNTYNGKAQRPAVSKVAGKTLGSADVAVAYSNASSADAGSYTVTVTGRGNYVGTAKAASYSIEPASIKGASVALAWAKKAYTGKVLKPGVSKVGGKALKSGKDFVAKYSSASPKAVGSYIVTVTGKGNYAGTAKAKYSITMAGNSAKAKWTSKTYKLKANKKTRKLAKASKVALPKVSSKFGTVKWVVSKKDAKKVLSVSGNALKVKKGAKAGTYQVKLVAKVKATKNYKAAASKAVTVKVRIA